MASAAPNLLLIQLHDPAVRSVLGGLVSLLDDEERQRWQRYRRVDDQERFLLARAVLRVVLGQRLNRDPTSLRFGRNAHSKPFLQAPGGGSASVQFNVSHSGDCILLGFHADQEVGVDVEQLRPGLNWVPIARRCLAPEICASIASLPADQQSLAFHRHWCRLEATLKARGVGLCGDDGDPAADRDPGSAGLWEVQLPEGYVGAAALDAPPRLRDPADGGPELPLQNPPAAGATPAAASRPGSPPLDR